MVSKHSKVQQNRNFSSTNIYHPIMRRVLKLTKDEFDRPSIRWCPLDEGGEEDNFRVSIKSWGCLSRVPEFAKLNDWRTIVNANHLGVIKFNDHEDWLTVYQTRAQQKIDCYLPSCPHSRSSSSASPPLLTRTHPCKSFSAASASARHNDLLRSVLCRGWMDMPRQSHIKQ